MGGGLPIHRCIEGQDHFTNAFAPDPVEQLGDAQILGPHVIERRKRAAKHMVAALEGMAPFHRPQVGHVLDNADLAIGAGVTGADCAGVGGADIAAGQAFAGAGSHMGHRVG